MGSLIFRKMKKRLRTQCRNRFVSFVFQCVPAFTEKSSFTKTLLTGSFPPKSLQHNHGKRQRPDVSGDYAVGELRALVDDG